MPMAMAMPMAMVMAVCIKINNVIDINQNYALRGSLAILGRCDLASEAYNNVPLIYPV